MNKRIVSLVVALCLICSMMFVSASAMPIVAAIGTTTNDHNYVNGICTVCYAISYDFFGADEEVTRGKMCYLLWAMNGCPETNYTRAYVDLSKDDYYYTAIMWAVENGITIGISDSQFAPLNKCNRAQVVAFLFRVAGSPEPTCTENIFIDVYQNVYYHKAVLWAVEQKLQIANVCDNQFNPYATTTFSQILGDEIIHFAESIPAVPATCTETGLTEGKKCSVCDNIIVAQEVVPAMGHTEEIVPAVPATCTKNGLTEGKICSICGEILLAQNVVEAQGHAYESVVTAPTCAEQGYTTYICSCDDSYVSDYVDALGHDMGEWKTVTAPTCTEEGAESRICSRCDHTETRSIDALGHSYTSTVTVPTCTERGYTIYTCKCGESYAADYVDALGHSFGGWTVIQEPTTTEDGLEERSCARCGHTEQRTVAKLENPFNDVKLSDFYYTPVLWALEKGITSGTAPDEFSPYDSCLRSQVVTFLWRAAGKPKAESARNPFEDVKPTDYYYKAVLWAVEKGITTGADATHFEPNGVCNRSQVVTFLYRAFGKPPVGNVNNPFTDVSSGDWYASAVLWAVREGITSGLSATKFGPNDVCNRSQVVTFLYRAYN